MLEGLVSTLLNRFLGMYVQNFDPKQLNVGIWSGDVVLRDLELRREALDQLRLPLNVIEGHLGSLTLSIPWSNLRGKPLKVNIEDVFLLAAPKEDADYDAEEEDKRAHAVKMEKLDSAELLKERNTEGMSAEEQQKNQSFTASLITAIVDNVQVTVKNIHIRYEDSIADPGHPFALGVTLADFSAISTDENWKPTFIQGTSTSTHKLATLGSLAVYWDTDAQLIGTGKGSQSSDEQQIDREDFIEQARSMIARGDNPDLDGHQFILKPISGRAGLEIDKTGKPDRPKMKARLLFDELGFIIDEDQYRDALMLVDLFHYFIRHQEYKRLQPKSSPKEDPAGWLRFATKAVLDKIHERNRQWSWDYFKERRDDRIRYIELFKKKKREEKLDATEAEDLDKLERKLKYEDLRFWRSLARNQLRKENVGVKKPPPKQTWTSWVWGSKQEEQQDDNTQMNEQQRKELYNAIDWDEKKAITESVDMPREYVKLEVNMSLRTGSFTLKRDPHGKSNEILRLLFDSFSTQFLQRTDSMFVKVALEGMRLYDGTTEGSLFPQIITVKDAPPVPDDKRIEELDDDESPKDADGDDDDEVKEDPFFFLTFENNPLDGAADTNLTMKLRSMEFVYNPTFVVEVAKFFKPPERHMESIGALMETAGATVEGIRQQTRAGLEFALTEHKTINAQLDLQAPLIIVPDSVTKKSSNCLILDAGHVSVTSELVDKDTLRDIQSKQNQQYTDEDFRRLENLMYDKFNLKLHSTQVLIGPSIEETRAQLEEDSSLKNYHIVDRINMDFKIEICIVPKASDLTKFRVSGNLPVLHASVSDSKYKNLMRLIDVAVPKFGDDQPSKPVTDGAKGPSNLKPPTDAQTDTDALGRPRSKSFKFASQEHELVMEEDSQSDTDDKFSDAPQAKSGKQQTHLHQRNFEFKFTVDKLQGSLYRADPEGKKSDQLLVELIAESFDLDFYQAAFEMAADVRLKSLAVEDHVEESTLTEFKNIISSEDVSADEQKDLFSLKFVKVNKESPDFQSKYEGIATNLDVAVSTINLIVTRRTLLTLLDFVLDTFTTPGPPQNQQAQITDKEEEQPVVSQTQAEPDKIRIRAELKRIAVVLNNDGIRLATLSLSSGDVGIFLSGKTMRIGGRLGNLSLIDDINQGVSEESSLRQLVTIEGKNLADFSYETFDSESKSYPGYDMAVALKTGSIKINFLTEPFRKIMEFAVKFGKMQAIFNAARQAAANQATQIQQRANKFHFDITISTPIVVFPRMVVSDKPDRDTLTANLGEIYAKNSFVPLDDSESAETANKITAGIRNIKLTSKLHYDEDRSEQLQLIDKVDLDFNITMVEHKPGQQRPDIEIDGNMSDINLQLTPDQMKFALELSRSIPAAFATEPDAIDEDVQAELPNETTEPARRLTDKDTPEPSSKDIVSSQGPELHTDDGKWTKLDFVFKVGTIGLELVKSTDGEPVGDVEAASLSKFSLNDTNVKVRMISDGAMEAELVVQSFTIRDSRTQGTNKFRKIMSLINNDVKQQFMASVSISGGQERNMIALLTIDSPRIILALDYLFALQAFANAGLATDEPLVIEEDTELDETDSDDEIMSPDGSRQMEQLPAPEESTDNGMNISFRVNLVDAQVVLIANPAMASSEAIVLGTKQVLVSKQRAMTLQVDKVGMFLCRMDRFETNRMRILDDFSIQTALDIRNQGSKSSVMSITVDIEPLVLRLSLRDILLAMQIVNRASAMAAPAEKGIPSPEAQQLKAGTPSKKGTSHAGKASTHKPRTKSLATTKRSTQQAVQQQAPPPSTVLKREELHISIEGIRVVLIGDVHEMPMLDWRVKKFGVDVRDWSGPMVADTSLDTLVNVYNFSKSAWEPLIEPWSVGFHMSKDQDPDKLAVDIYSQEEGFAARLEDGEEQPWRFEDPMSARESLSTDGATGMLGIKLEGSGFDSLTRVPVHREGEFLYNLKPKQDRIQHRLLIDVKLGSDNIKNITIRSPLLVENNTQIPIELGMFSPEDGHLLKIDKIAPGDARPAPVGACHMHSIVIRPDQGFGYEWSNERLFWKDLLKRPTRTITCRGEQDDQSPPFYFQLHAAYDKKDPLTGIYPYMRLRLQAPVEVHNLLPYDFKYRIYDSNTKKDWTNFLRKGGISPVHVVELSHLLLISVEMQDGSFKPSKFGIINSTDRESFRREKVLEVKDNNDTTLHLNMHFYNFPDGGGAFKVAIYSPYIILNRTGLQLDVRAQQLMGQGRATAGKGVVTDNQQDAGKALPFMFSYPTENKKNRALIKVGDSNWSKPQSFDAIGSTYTVALPSMKARSDMHLGVSVSEGEGKYNLTKTVSIAPRFIVNNKLKEELLIREPGQSDWMTVKDGELFPLRWLRQGGAPQLSLCYPGINNQWSSPFNISNVGNVHVKLSKAGQRQKLIRVDILMEAATIFCHISVENKHWPFSFKNMSDQEFLYWQANPNLDEDEDDRGSGFRPIRYRLPPRSIMPYAWDFPAAKNKEIVISANGRERHVKLAEIGPLIPFKIPPGPEQGGMKVIDLNVVAAGPTQTLEIANYKPSKSMYKQKSTTASSTMTGFEVKDMDTDVTFKAQLRLAGIGISLVNRHLKELVYVTLRDIEFKYSDSPLYQMINMQIKWIQIDNQLYGGIFPIIFYPSVVPKTGKEMEAHPIFQTTITKVKDDSYGVLYIKYFTFLLQQMTVEIDEDFIFAMIDFANIPGASWTEEKQGKLWDENLSIPEPKQEQSGQDVYFELLHLQPMQIDLSFVRTERINAEDTMSTSNPFMFAVNVLTMSIGNVNDAPVRYNSLMLENARISTTALINNIKNHYVQESLRQVHVIIGSADFLGNPVGLFNNISSGVADIFYEPYQGLVKSDRPEDLGIGIAKGASSFVKKSVFGFSDSMAKFTGSMSKGLSAATLDKEFQDSRRMSRSRNRPKHALYGITSGGNAFASSLASGLGGLARHPIQGAEKEGALGFVKGVGKGLLGVPTKAAIGAFDLASNMAEGVRNTTTVFDQEGLDRVRLTRFIGTDGIVRPYSQREALGQFWLKTLDNGKYFNEDYIAHLELQNKEMLVMLTYNGLMMVRTKKLQTEWDVPLKDVQTISKERTGLGITLKGGTNGPFIPVSDEGSRNWFYRQVAVGVNAYNDRWNAKG
ncbi:vacuolar protein sorting-associated protein 13a [Pyrenophora tritici-repentis Pt-1C-BFP]|uniref:Vacuolar protein sorting-associated protein n=1 Tax=Pyrenophora tritici-repentis (strain Pt-1C-BFP) TaxID=426418 RepID=B2VZ22_PYRTR|nr:vacuolar protein sorting-associated protein 13a [Pyrenophora tritici-repentis Pt-1C-BFP]EDU45185.1 vacuolar protein sorting-associated protein 13a [Pyrenophora tritici-repentis Pt-1C-BFP]